MMETRIEMTMRPLPGITEEFIAGLRDLFEKQLERDLKQVEEAAPARRIYAWAAVAKDYRQLAPIEYAAGEPFEECRRALDECARAQLEVVKLRGNGRQAGAEWTPPPEYSTGNSRSTFVAVCMALAAGDGKLARELAEWIWDPEGVAWIFADSTICTSQQQTVAYAMKDLLLGRAEAAETALRAMTKIREDVIGELLMLRGIATRDRARVLKGLGLAIEWHRRVAKIEDFDPEYFLAISALGLARLAVEQGIITTEELPAGEVYFPKELIEC